MRRRIFTWRRRATLASVRHTIDTRDEFYDAEETFWNAATPELDAYEDAWKGTMLESPFRKEFAAEYGDLMFVNAEIARKAFSPEIIPESQQENDLSQAYSKLIASAQIPFEGGVYTISQLSPFKNDPDDARRLAAWQAEGAWYKEHQAEFDEIYDKMVHLRDTMGKKPRLRRIYDARLLPDGAQLLRQGRCGAVPRGSRKVSRSAGGQHLPRAGEAGSARSIR